MLAYLHVPFCDSKCHYCAFNSYVDKFDLRADYMRAATIQLKYEIAQFQPKKNIIKSFFIGGGTPSTINAELYREFFDVLSPYLASDAEITTEANPNSASRSWLDGMRNLGVNRVSFGTQSFDAAKLKFLGRNHSKDQAITAILNAHVAGFKNISLDLIYATSQDSPQLLENDLQIAFSLPINHLSAYALTLEENTPFFGKNHLTNPKTSLAREFISKIQQKFPQYEISNFGTYRSVHNLGYWRGDDYMGIGAGAVGFLKNRRFYPQKDITEYIQDPIFRDTEQLSSDDLILEKIFLGLRSIVGIDSCALSSKQIEKCVILEEQNKLTCKDGVFYNTDYLLADEIALFIV